MKEEMMAFLQEGLHTYAPALGALSEFRRQIYSRLQSVLAEYSRELSKLGLPIAGLKLVGTKLDESDPGETWIGLGKNHGAELSTAYYVQWNPDKPKCQSVWVAAEVYVGIRTDRDRLFSALQEHSALIKANLKQVPNGTSCLYAYCDPDAFYCFDEPFRALIAEWVLLLSAVGGVRPFVSSAAATLLLPGHEDG